MINQIDEDFESGGSSGDRGAGRAGVRTCVRTCMEGACTARSKASLKLIKLMELKIQIMEQIAGIEKVKLAALVYAPAHVHAHTHPAPPLENAPPAACVEL